MAAPIRFARIALRDLFRRSDITFSSSYCTASSSTLDGSTLHQRDPMPVFMRKDIQSLLHNMTGLDLLRLAGPKKIKVLTRPKYKLLTDQELNELQQAAEERLKHRLQMPLFMKTREPIKEVLSSDPDLQGLDDSKHVFTDITYAVKNRHRVIVIREPDGTLRKAAWEERDRINQIYNPVEGRQFHMPKIFQEPYLEASLKEMKFVYILDMACIQFEPDDPEYIRVVHHTYEAVDAVHHYDDLRSTRHFGPMAFYYAWYKKIDYLLIDMINRELLSDAGDLVQLYCIVNPDSAITHKLTAENTSDVIRLLKIFCSVEASHKGQMELAIQGYEEKLRMSAAAKS